MSEPTTAPGPDLTAGVPVKSLKESVPLAGHVGGEPVILVKRVPKWDTIEVRGDLAARAALVIFRQAGRPLAVVTVDRHRANLEAEATLERDGYAGLETFLSARGS